MAERRPFAAIVEQTPDAIIFADRSGVIQVWNHGAEAVFGFSAAEVIGSGLDAIIPERLRPAHWEGFRRALEKGHTRALAASGPPDRFTRMEARCTSTWGSRTFSHQRGAKRHLGRWQANEILETSKAA